MPDKKIRNISNSRVAIPDVVDAPTIGTATAGIEQATVTFTPAVTGGVATSFTAISTPGSITASATASPITVTGLTGGTSYTFKVYGTNNSGTWNSVQSSASGSVTAIQPTAFESIASATGTGSSGTITFSSIPGTYQHLQIRFIARDTGAGTTTDIVSLNLNSDSTSANYARHTLYGNGTSVAAEGSTASTQLGPWAVNGAATASTVGVGIIDIHDYASSTKYKTIRAFGGANNNSTSTSFEIGLTSILWKNTNAITSISLVCGNNFATSSTFALYGIKGA